MALVQCKSCGYNNPPEARFCANCGTALVGMVEPPSPAVSVVAVEYMGFWIRFGASIIDGIIISFVSFVFSHFSDARIVFGILLPWLYYWLFTGLRGQTPGKMVVGIKVVNVQGDIPGLGIAALREILGKFISTIGLCLGFLWIAWDSEKQGWHDKIANTYVVKAKSRG